MAAILGNPVIVVRTRPREILLAMITTRKSINAFPFLTYLDMESCFSALRVAGAPQKSSKLSVVGL